MEQAHSEVDWQVIAEVGGIVRKFLALIVIVCGLLTGCSTSDFLDPSGGSTASEQDFNEVKEGVWYKVSECIDGDTFSISVGEKKEYKVRLLSVDTPETKNGVEPWGPEAAARTAELLTGKEVSLDFDIEKTDRYGRLLAVVTLKDGTNLNELLLSEGLAEVMIVEPNDSMEKKYREIQRKAQREKKGMWSQQQSASQGHTDKPSSIGEIGIAVDKSAEIVTITNNGKKELHLKGWKLVSVKGNQSFVFPEQIIKPGGSITVTSGEEAGTLDWGARNIWNNSDSDPAELYDTDGQLVARWND